jgi:hypothetical protein
MLERVKDISVNPKNPRRISDEKLQMLKGAIDEFGDLGAIIYNRTSKQLVGGHQRLKLVDKNAKIKIDKTYSSPTRTGTIAEGFIAINGERFKYREVVWDGAKEKAAAIAANRNAGDWDNDLLGDWLRELENDSSINLDLTMFDAKERRSFFSDFEEKEPKPKKDKTRVTSDDVQDVKLTLTKEKYERFSSNVEYFQKYFSIENVTDTVCEVLEACRQSAEDDARADAAKAAKQ